MKLVLGDALKVIEHNRSKGGNVGFHPTLRNYFIRNGKAVYVDTFPPMVGGKKTVARIIEKQVFGSRLLRTVHTKSMK